MKAIKAFFTFLIGFLTDAKNRPAIEVLVGVALLPFVAIYAFGGFGKPDVAILSVMSGLDLVFFGLNTAGNIFDKSGGGQ